MLQYFYALLKMTQTNPRCRTYQCFHIHFAVVSPARCPPRGCEVRHKDSADLLISVKLQTTRGL